MEVAAVYCIGVVCGLLLGLIDHPRRDTREEVTHGEAQCSPLADS